MSEFKKGQLVAVRDAEGCEWALRVYDHASPEGLHFCTGLERSAPPCWWSQVAPAEVVWPHLFLSVEREIAATLREQCDKHYRQVRWLCSTFNSEEVEANGLRMCPANPPDGFCPKKNCAECWEKASFEATKEGVDAD